MNKLFIAIFEISCVVLAKKKECHNVRNPCKDVFYADSSYVDIVTKDCDSKKFFDEYEWCESSSSEACKKPYKPKKCEEKNKQVVDQSYAIAQIETILTALTTDSAALVTKKGADINANIVKFSQDFNQSVLFQLTILSQALTQQLTNILDTDVPAPEVTEPIEEANAEIFAAVNTGFSTLTGSLSAVINNLATQPDATIVSLVQNTGAGGFLESITTVLTNTLPTIVNSIAPITAREVAAVEEIAEDVAIPETVLESVLAAIAEHDKQVQAIIENELNAMVEALSNFVDMLLTQLNLSLELLYIEKGKQIIDVVRSIGSSTNGSLPIPHPVYESQNSLPLLNRHSKHCRRI
ncbi:hypothetical protein EDEG_02326 [Edhazardia aedis USNM 41457]|uniref:Uncharacterized protein n=1 Tax=Edhazardia aedis (strain USNM 41457) TaxID=1003232 RepID=J9D727_EDHAE|nr:hypothetical protein EDEG_02326 [Edhazardia aedis USNM 41457]|eukprot:EJW03339.1 hypothetical protein EDEG_02326 [Edhazardia aedis USNM 41457]